LKAITHAQKEMMLQYFEVVETQLRRALKEAAAAGTPTRDPSFIEVITVRVQERIADIAAQIPGASTPSFQQIRKNLETVLDPAFFGNAKGDPIKAVRSLQQQLRCQPEYTPPKGGMWKRAKQVRRSNVR